MSTESPYDGEGAPNADVPQTEHPLFTGELFNPKPYYRVRTFDELCPPPKPKD